MEENKKTTDLGSSERPKQAESYSFIDILKRDIEEAKKETERSEKTFRDDIIDIRKNLKNAKTSDDISNIILSIMYSLNSISEILSSVHDPLSTYLERYVSPELWKKAGYDERTVQSLRNMHQFRFERYKSQLNELLKEAESFIPDERIKLGKKQKTFREYLECEQDKVEKIISLIHDVISNGEHLPKKLAALTIVMQEKGYIKPADGLKGRIGHGNITAYFSALKEEFINVGQRNHFNTKYNDLTELPKDSPRYKDLLSYKDLLP